MTYRNNQPTQILSRAHYGSAKQQDRKKPATPRAPTTTQRSRGVKLRKYNGKGSLDPTYAAKIPTISDKHVRYMQANYRDDDIPPEMERVMDREIAVATAKLKEIHLEEMKEKEVPDVDEEEDQALEPIPRGRRRTLAGARDFPVGPAPLRTGRGRRGRVRAVEGDVNPRS